MFSFAAVQGMMDRYYPGRATPQICIHGRLRLFGYKRTMETQAVCGRPATVCGPNAPRCCAMHLAARSCRCPGPGRTQRAPGDRFDLGRLAAAAAKKGTSLNALWHVAHFVPRPGLERAAETWSRRTGAGVYPGNGENVWR